MNPTEQAKRVAWFEAAHQMHEETGIPLERCLVEVQRQEIALVQLDQRVKAFLAWWDEVYVPSFKSLVKSVVDAMMPAIEAFQALWDQMEAPLKQPQCPIHRTALRGGACRVCQRFDRHRGF